MFGTTTPLTPLRSLATLLVVGSLATLAACGSSDSGSDAPDTTTAAVTQLTLSGAWARTSPAASTTGAAYVTITSPVDDALIGVSVDTSIAADGAEVHEMVMAGDSSMGGTTVAGGSGEMTMQPVARVELPAGTAVSLAPGGYHIMLMGLVQPLERGTTIQLTFAFEKAGAVTIDVPVLDEAPMP